MVKFNHFYIVLFLCFGLAGLLGCSQDAEVEDPVMPPIPTLETEAPLPVDMMAVIWHPDDFDTSIETRAIDEIAANGTAYAAILPPNQFAIREINGEGQLAVFVYENEISLKISSENLRALLLEKEILETRGDFSDYFIAVEKALAGESEIYHFTVVRCNALIYAKIPFSEKIAYGYLARLDNRVNTMLCQ